MSGRPDFARLSVLIVHFPSPRQPFRPGGGRAALWQTRERNTTVTRVLAPIQGSPAPPRAARPTNHAGAYALLAPFGARYAIGEPGILRRGTRGPQLRPCLADEASGRPATAFRSCRSRPNLAGVGPVRQAPRRPRPDAQAADSAALTWSARMPGSSVTGLRPKPQYAASPNSGRYLRANATRCRNRSILWIAPR